MGALIGLIGTAISELAPLLTRALTAKQEEAQAIAAELAAIGTKLAQQVAELPGVLAAHDAAADAALVEKFASPK